MKKMNPPEWLSEGPMDLEYKSYKMLSKVKELRRMLRKGNLDAALSEIDPALDYLYLYDAVQAIDEDLHVLPPEFDPELENVYTSRLVDVERNNVVDQLCMTALDLFEDLHAEAREMWRDIEEGTEISYLYNRPMLINDGFIFVTEGKKLHIYSFVKPNQYIFDWREFNPKLIQTKTLRKNDITKYVQELVEADSNKIMINIRYSSKTPVGDGVFCVIKSVVFNLLKRDYGF
jgi:hypothetical protein